jgi:hypothetical protein
VGSLGNFEIAGLGDPKSGNLKMDDLEVAQESSSLKFPDFGFPNPAISSSWFTRPRSWKISR